MQFCEKHRHAQANVRGFVNYIEQTTNAESVSLAWMRGVPRSNRTCRSSVRTQSKFGKGRYGILVGQKKDRFHDETKWNGVVRPGYLGRKQLGRFPVQVHGFLHGRDRCESLSDCEVSARCREGNHRSHNHRRRRSCLQSERAKTNPTIRPTGRRCMAEIQA